MERDIILNTYSELKDRLRNQNYDIYSERNYVFDRSRYLFDIVVKKDDKELALFEIKTNISKVLAPNTQKELQELCKRYLSLFPKAKPLIFISNGEDYYEYTSDKQFKSTIKIKDVCEKMAMKDLVTAMQPKAINNVLHHIIENG